MNKTHQPSSTKGQMFEQDSTYLSVSEAAQLVNDTLEFHFPQLLFRGEISQLTVAQSGHVYFTIKDEGAQLSCALWAGLARTLPFKPRVGLTVRCHARPNVYSQTGRFQMIVHRLVEDGEGELRRRFLELQKRLADDGFFAPDRKRPLPFLPKAVGLVTSSTGAVIHDMMVKIRERFPSMVVYLADTRVQGEGAAAEISQAIRRLDRSNLVDVIIVARGGGSLEDLWAFNEEEVVRAVFSSSRPVVSGVGHEVDVTLCDLAADVRAPTPTAAAEMVVPKLDDLVRRVDELSRRLADTDRWFQLRVQRVDDLSQRLQTRLIAVGKEARLRLRAGEAALTRIRPDRVMELLSVRLRNLAQRLQDSVRRMQSERMRIVTEYRQRLERSLSVEDVKVQSRILQSLQERLSVAGMRTMHSSIAAVDAMSRRLEAVSPQAVLSRGFAIVYVQGKSVKSVSEVSAGNAIDVRLADGIVSGVVEATKEVREDG